MIPEAVLSELLLALTPNQGRPGIQSVRPAGGGCISQAAIVRLTSGESLFLKCLVGAPKGFYQAEAQGLAALAAGGPLRVPRVVHLKDEGGTHGYSWIAMEDLSAPPRGLTPPANRAAHQAGTSYDEELGRGLAELHRTTAPRFGFDSDNFIGPTPQHNGWMERWLDFFRERRLAPLLRRLRQAGKLPEEASQVFARLSEQLDALLAGDDSPPSLLHGDLWSGNVLPDFEGRPALIDPAVYFGSREAELAYTELFGGFGERFYAAYREAWPLRDGYAERRDLYNLYHLLNHTLLFGGSYLAQAVRTAKRYVG